MATMERVREFLSGPLSPEYLQRKTGEGWKLAAVVWERELEDQEEQQKGELREYVPFGLKVSDDCEHLEEDSVERQVLLFAMELIVQDIRLTQVADELNRRGFRTRHSTKWTPGAVFDLLPRLIEVGPRIFSSEEWVVRRQHLFIATVRAERSSFE